MITSYMYYWEIMSEEEYQISKIDYKLHVKSLNCTPVWLTAAAVVIVKHIHNVL